MLKENWTYKKLGEVCEIYQPQTISTDNLVPNGDYYVYGANGIIGKYDRYNHKDSEVLLTCRGATCGAINISKPFSWINGNAMVIHPIDNSTFCSRTFLVYLMKSLDYSLVITGAAQPQITRQKISPVKVAIPPIETQSQIVSELDLLQSLIDKQQAQLKEYNNLAQSIFYDMFGEPVENDKGWKTGVLTTVAPQKQYDGTIPSVNGKYWLVNLDMVEQQTGSVINKVLFNRDEIGNSTITFDTTNVLYSKLRPYLNKVVVPDGIGYGTSELVPLKPNPTILERVFLAHLLRSKSFVDYISVKVAGAKMPRVSMDVLRNFPVILPPLSLQQSFAEKIEAIEKQKAAISQSIEETQKLFDYTMDKYFG